LPRIFKYLHKGLGAIGHCFAGSIYIRFLYRPHRLPLEKISAFGQLMRGANCRFGAA
jgi:hypothetical protein